MADKNRENTLSELRVAEFVAASSMARAILDARVDGVDHSSGDTVQVDARAWREILQAFRQYRHARWDMEDFHERGHRREYDGRRELTPLKHPWTR